MSGFEKQCEPRLQPTIVFDVLKEHCVRTHPETGLVVEGTIHDQRFERLAVSCNADDFVLAALVVTVAPEPWFWKWGQIAH